MKLKCTSTLIILLHASLLLWASFVSPAHATSPDASTGAVGDRRLFYEKLAPYGDWVRFEPYGWVWVPLATGVGWRPYTEGRWVYTEAGMTWVSEWLWGWAAFHYGRWLFTAQYGWVWVPDTVWAPAWVAWQVGNGWVGWGPLPPQVRWDPQVGLLADRLALVTIEPLQYIFVEAPQVLAPDLLSHLASPARNVTLLLHTKNVTAYIPVRERADNRSLSMERVEQLVGHTVPRYEIQNAVVASSNLISQVRGKEIVMFRPVLTRPLPGSEPPPPTLAPPQESLPLQPPNTARQALEERLSAERARLLARQERETERRVSQGRPAEHVVQQHERERNAFEVYAERERQVLEHRLQRKRRGLRFRLEYDERDPWQSLYE